MTTAIPNRQQEQPPDFDAREEDLRRRKAELTEERGRLSFDAMSGKKGDEEKLNTVKNEIAVIDQELEDISLGRKNGVRREEEATRDAAEKVRAAAERRAAKLEPEVRKAEQKVDETAATFAEAVAARSETLGKLEQARHEAGNGGAGGYVSTTPLEGAVKFALGQAGVPRAIDLPPGPTAPFSSDGDQQKHRTEEPQWRN